MQGSDTPPGRICRKIHVMVDGVSVHVTEKTAEKTKNKYKKLVPVLSMLLKAHAVQPN